MPCDGGAIVSFARRDSMWPCSTAAPRHLRAARIIYILYTRSFFFLSRPRCCCVHSPLKNTTAHACPIASVPFVALASSSSAYLGVFNISLELVRVGGYLFSFSVALSLFAFLLLFFRSPFYYYFSAAVISPALCSISNDLVRPSLFLASPPFCDDGLLSNAQHDACKTLLDNFAIPQVNRILLLTDGRLDTHTHTRIE